MPIRVAADAVAGPGGLTGVTVHAASAESWYAIGASTITGRMFERSFDEVFRSVRAALAPIIAESGQ